MIIRGDRRVVGGDVVVGGRQGAVGAADLAVGEAEAVEGLRRGDLVDEVQVDVDQPLADLVVLPDLVEQRARCVTRLCGQLSSSVAVRRRSRRAVAPRSLRDCAGDGEGRRRRWRCRPLERVDVAVDDQIEGAVEDDDGLSAARLVNRRIAGAAGRGARGRACAGRRRRAGREAAGSAPRSRGRGGGCGGPSPANDDDVAASRRGAGAARG